MCSDSNPLVSVIIPFYNHEKYLSEAIDSVLAQDYKPYELILVDDGSIDGGRAIAESYSEAKVISQANAGTGPARNRGLQESHGEFVAFLDADDLWTPNKLSLQMAAFSADPTLDIVTGYVQQFYDAGLGPQFEKNRLRGEPQIGYSPIAILLKRDVFDKLGFFHDNLVAEFISWFMRVNEVGCRIHTIPDLVAYRRIHGENISLRLKNEKNKLIVRLLKESIDRRRDQTIRE